MTAAQRKVIVDMLLEHGAEAEAKWIANPDAVDALISTSWAMTPGRVTGLECSGCYARVDLQGIVEVEDRDSETTIETFGHAPGCWVMKARQALGLPMAYAPGEEEEPR